MAEVTIVVCDVCGSLDRHTTRYRIARGQESSHFDLCEEHAGPVEAVLATKGPGPVTSASEPVARDELAAHKAPRR